MRVESDGLPPLKSYEEKKEEADVRLSRKVTLVLSILSFSAGLFFWSSGITGNAVGTTQASTSTVLGSVLMVASVAGFFLYVSASRRKK